MSPSGRITATWNRHPDVIRRALGRLPSALSTAPPVRRVTAARSTRGTAAGAVYTGLGFDACTAPSPAAMSAWSSRYHAIGHLHRRHERGVPGLEPDRIMGEPGIRGGLAHDPDLRGPSGPKRLVRLVLGDQPTQGGRRRDCGRQRRDQRSPIPRTRGRQPDLLRHGGLSPRIRDDLDGAQVPLGLDRAASLSRLRLGRLQQRRLGHPRTWRPSTARATSSPTTSGMPTGTARRSTSDPLHPGRGLDLRISASISTRAAHSETHGRFTLNIDRDYLDGSTAGPASVAPAPAPSVKVRPGVDGSVRLNAAWPGATRIAAWQVLAGPEFRRADAARHTVHRRGHHRDHRAQPVQLLRRGGAQFHGSAARDRSCQGSAGSSGDLRTQRLRPSPRSGRAPGRLLHRCSTAS